MFCHVPQHQNGAYVHLDCELSTATKNTLSIKISRLAFKIQALFYVLKQCFGFATLVSNNQTHSFKKVMGGYLLKWNLSVSKYLKNKQLMATATHGLQGAVLFHQPITAVNRINILMFHSVKQARGIKILALICSSYGYHFV